MLAYPLRPGVSSPAVARWLVEGSPCGATPRGRRYLEPGRRGARACATDQKD